MCNKNIRTSTTKGAYATKRKAMKPTRASKRPVHLQAIQLLAGVAAAHLCWSLVSGLLPSNRNAVVMPTTDESPVKKEPYLVVCTRMRNEAPYLREWVEFHRLLGFDKIFLVNDKSTDDTECILDVYNSSKIEGDDLVWKIDSKVRPRFVFEECARLIREEPQFDASNTWMMTHDLDEFLWFDTNLFANLKEAIVHFSSWHEGQVKSIQIPRLLFGASGLETPDDRTMIERFTNRYDPNACPTDTTVNTCNSYNYCGRDYEDPITNVKSISLVSEIAENCFSEKKIPGKKMKNAVPEHCMSTHYHEIVDPDVAPGSAQLVNARKSHAAVYLKPTETQDRPVAELGKEVDDERGTSGTYLWDTIMVAHYYVKSRAEFYHRICDSRFFDKYYDDEGCTPATNFDTLAASANVLEDRRLANNPAFPASRDLNAQLAKTAPYFSQCNAAPIQAETPAFYEECWQRQEATIKAY